MRRMAQIDSNTEYSKTTKEDQGEFAKIKKYYSKYRGIGWTAEE